MSQFSRKLVLEARARVPDGAGGFNGAWAALGTLWGEVRPASGRLERGDEVARSRVAYRIKVRAVAQNDPSYPKSGQRFLEGDRVYAIRSVALDTDARFLSCLVDEEVAS